MNRSEIGLQLNQAEKKIREDTVRKLYDGYTEVGIRASVETIIEAIPDNLQQPIIYTLTCHVTKEKPMMVYGLARAWEIEQTKAAGVAGTVDLLWALSLMYDDIYDNDEMRAGQPSTWSSFGREKTTTAVESGLKATHKFIDSNFGNNSANFCLEQIYTGLASVKQLKQIPLDANLDTFITNYDQRAFFHCAYPIYVLNQLTNGDHDSTQATEALLEVNRAGQILNDVRDMDPQSAWQRQGFSDIRSSTPTIPLHVMWGGLSNERKEQFKLLFGKNNLTKFESDEINNMLLETNTLTKVKSLITSTYQSSVKKYHAENISTEHSDWFDQWVKYKHKHIDQILGKY